MPGAGTTFGKPKLTADREYKKKDNKNNRQHNHYWFQNDVFLFGFGRCDVCFGYRVIELNGRDVNYILKVF